MVLYNMDVLWVLESEIWSNLSQNLSGNDLKVSFSGTEMRIVICAVSVLGIYWIGTKIAN